MTVNLIEREALLKQFVEELRNQYYYEDQKADYEQLVKYLRDGSVSVPALQHGFYSYNRTLLNLYWKMLSPDPHQWDDADDRLLTFAFTPRAGNSYNLSEESFYESWLVDQVNKSISPEAIGILVHHLARYNVSEAHFWLMVLHHLSLYYSPHSALATWILERADQYHTPSLASLQQPMLAYLKLLLKRKPEFVKTHLADFLHLSSYNYRKGLDTKLVQELLKHDATSFAKPIADLKQRVTDPGTFRDLQLLLAHYLPDQYRADTLAAAYEYLDLVRREMNLPPGQVYYSGYERVDSKDQYELTVKLLFDRILKLEAPDKAKTYLYEWLKTCPTPRSELFDVVADRLEQESIPLLLLGLEVDSKGAYYDPVQLARHVLKLLTRFDYSEYYPQIWAMARHKSKQKRELAAVTLAKLGEPAIPKAEQLLKDKKADVRQTGALLLSLIRTDQSQALLREALDAEKNDDARDLMLESLKGLLPTPATEAELAALVDNARQRGKLNAPVASYLTEKALPGLYWQTSGEPLDADTVRFLLYRQSRSRDIRPDTEARPLYALIDRQRSVPFAQSVLNAYIEAGADPKGKGCLTVSAMLGGDDEVDLLKSKVNQWVEGGRGKMAEYAVQALALIGSNKALRAVEFYARKYKNKNKNIGAAANEAFVIAADTLGISPYDLADSIIPDFGFEGLFRLFEVGGETYRAFVGTDFKLAFLDEDNKLIKTVPKAAPADLKEEFKETGKEIRDIVKAQSGRLEQYLVIQRKWSAGAWQSFFLGNPVMFAYAVRLIWGAFDKEQNRLFTFQCTEDQTLINEEGDEVELPDDALIGMVHPLSLTPEQIEHWSSQLADADVEPIFPQLTRRVVQLPDDGRNRTLDGQFDSVEYGGYGFVSKMEKLGWFRGSVQDAGFIASYYKDFTELGITAVLTQVGNIGVGYYDENAALGQVMFARAKSIQFGNYVYDEPSKETDPRLIPFGNVPPIVYSEVMADLLFFKENDVRKTKPTNV